MLEIHPVRPCFAPHLQLDESNGGEKEHDADDVAVTQTKSVEINGVSVRGGRGYTMHVAK
jgi:hypothetical protein